MHILLVGSGTREHCLAWKLAQSKHTPKLSCFASHRNPGILDLCTHYSVGNINNPEEVVKFAQQSQITLVVIGPEAPLATGVADALWNVGIPVVGPRKALAQLETSKAFTRDLVKRYIPEVNPACKYFTHMQGVEEFIVDDCSGSFVIKNDGLKGGKGVLVMGDHFETVSEGIAICQETIDIEESFLIEEKLIGQEFSLFSFNDGKTLCHSIPIQDHKRAFEGDIGPNTGGMGTYSDANHLLPFLTEEHILAAQHINEQVAQALAKEFDDPYQGIMYGGFMVTKHGVKLIEYNARFGDPEVFNLLTLLETDLGDIFLAMVNQTLDQIDLKFQKQASVCKYLVPEGYPDAPVKGAEITVGDIPAGVDYFFGSVDQQGDKLLTLGSRAVALIAHGDTIAAAEQKVESATQAFSGPLYHRKDIGTKDLLDKKIAMMSTL